MDSKQKKLPAKKTGKKQFKSYAILVGVSVTDMTKEQLESHVYQLLQEIEKEKEERNFFQIERDKIQLFWEVTKTQLEEKDALLQLKDNEINEAELCHLAEIKLYKQKMKHVMFECQQHIDEKMKEKMGEKLNLEEEHLIKVKHLESDINKLKDEIFQLNIDKENNITNLRLEKLKALERKEHQYKEVLKTRLSENQTLKEKLNQAEESLNTRISLHNEKTDFNAESTLRNVQRELKKVKAENNFLFNQLQEAKKYMNDPTEKFVRKCRKNQLNKNYSTSQEEINGYNNN